MKLYSGLVERCFMTCCNDFTSKALSSKEVTLSQYPHIITQFSSPCEQDTCVQNCADKFMKHSERVGARFAELNAGEWSNPSWPTSCLTHEQSKCGQGRKPASHITKRISSDQLLREDRDFLDPNYILSTGFHVHSSASNMHTPYPKEYCACSTDYNAKTYTHTLNARLQYTENKNSHKKEKNKESSTISPFHTLSPPS